MSYWHRVISGLGFLLVLGAVGRAINTLASNETILEAALNFVLMSFPGIVMVYVGIRLPNMLIKPEFYSRIVAWAFGGVAVMGIVIGLRALHPGIEADITYGTRVVSLAIGSIAGLAIGVHDAKALTQAKTLKEQKKELEEKQAVEQQNEKLRRTEQRLEKANAQLEASNERLEQFAYAVSHDLQEPLRMVTSYLQLLEDRYSDELDEEGEEFIDFAVDGAERMREMIDGLLEYSRIETQGGEFDTVDLDAILDDVLTDLQFKIEETDAKITRDTLPTVEGDRSQLREVFQNLLTNAIEYSGDDPPRIHISAECEGPKWTISVQDEGIGIDPEDVDRIFDIFQRLHSAEEQDGSGIGLALCERIIERHDGEIWVDSEPGEGTTFFFTLPPAGNTQNSPDDTTRLEESYSFSNN